MSKTTAYAEPSTAAPVLTLLGRTALYFYSKGDEQMEICIRQHVYEARSQRETAIRNRVPDRSVGNWTRGFCAAVIGLSHYWNIDAHDLARYFRSEDLPADNAPGPTAIADAAAWFFARGDRIKAEAVLQLDLEPSPYTIASDNLRFRNLIRSATAAGLLKWEDLFITTPAAGPPSEVAPGSGPTETHDDQAAG